MPLSQPDDSGLHPQSFAAVDTHGLSLVHDDLPGRWHDGVSTVTLTRVDENSWRVSFDETLLGILTHVPPLAIGEAETWRIGDPEHHDLGVGASWQSWEDAVANLIDYRRRN